MAARAIRGHPARSGGSRGSAAGDVAGGGSFFARVYGIVRAVPRGRVATYGQVAALLGSPRAARTVGWALHALPEASDVPWHRVVNAQGRISTGCREHAASLQAALLRRESVPVDGQGRLQLARFLWTGPSRGRRQAARPRS
ncbi:MAG: MGMT family protein [Gemmatimonadota bacterium]